MEMIRWVSRNSPHARTEHGMLRVDADRWVVRQMSTCVTTLASTAGDRSTIKARVKPCGVCGLGRRTDRQRFTLKLTRRDWYSVCAELHSSLGFKERPMLYIYLFFLYRVRRSKFFESDKGHVPDKPRLGEVSASFLWLKYRNRMSTIRVYCLQALCFCRKGYR